MSRAAELAAKLRKQAEEGRSPILGHLHIEDRVQIEAAEELERLDELERAAQPVWPAVID